MTAVPLLTTSVVVSAEVDDKPFDVVLAADEREEFWTSWEEEEVLLDAFRELGRNVTRVRFADDRFDWSSAKMVLVRGLYAAPSYGFEYDDVSCWCVKMSCEMPTICPQYAHWFPLLLVTSSVLGQVRERDGTCQPQRGCGL